MIGSYTNQEMEWLLTGYSNRWPNRSIDIDAFQGDYRKGIVHSVLDITFSIADALIIIGKDLYNVPM